MQQSRAAPLDPSGAQPPSSPRLTVPEGTVIMWAVALGHCLIQFQRVESRGLCGGVPPVGRPRHGVIHIVLFVFYL